MTHFAYSQEVARRSGSNFYPALLFLRRTQRGALCAVYAFSRLVDDLVDQTSAREEALEELPKWRQRLRACYNGGGMDHPVMPELQEAIRSYRIPEQYFLNLLRGVEMDLKKMRYETFRELEEYCYCVAGTVGLICLRIFGGEGPAYERYAVQLGTAFQLTNILRDIGADWARGRLYLPQEDLRGFGYSEVDLDQRVNREAFLRLMDFEADRARQFFDAARATLEGKRLQRFLPSELMGRTYQGLLRKLQRERFPSLERQVSLTPLSRAWLIAGGLLRSLL